VARIEVVPQGGGQFAVRVEGWSFAVTASDGLAGELGAPDAQALVQQSFAFLLEREPVGSILPRFDLTLIERYFPEWREEMRGRWR
jgi:hypothetical protein